MLKAYFAELVRPWKLCSLAVGMAWLLYGALNFGIGDWNVGDSLIMGLLTYLTAPWVVRTLIVSLSQRPRLWMIRILIALIVAWSVIDGSYTLYNVLTHHPLFRAANFPASSALYFLAGCIWLYRGSLKDLWNDRHNLGKPIA